MPSPSSSQPPGAVPVTRERELFLAALERDSERERALFLREQCGADTGLYQRILALLSEHASMGDFLERPALQPPLTETKGEEGVAGPTGTVRTLEGEVRLGQKVGPYKLLQSIGEGGCGVVYMAEQEVPVRRRVALKLIKLGMDTRNVIARFEAERQALALMDHPNIAKVLDAGATVTGRPFFVMELVRGIRVTDYCDQHQLSTEDRLRLFVRVCQAIQHAHQKGVIHRDIKPSNILVTLHDGVPVPKVIDFGIAKATEQRLTDKTLFTEFRSFIGTPAYMSPEQAEMSGLDIDTRSDIYSLGVLLYELLVGTTPFDPEILQKVGVDECRRTIREEEPIRPSTRLGSMVEADLTTTASQRKTDGRDLISYLRGDLDWIVMKCLEKDRTRRYETASALAADIQRLLSNEPVEARPPSNWYRLQKLYLRHRVPLVAASLVLFTVVVGAVVSLWLAVRATHAEHEAQRSQHQEKRLRQEAEADKYRARLNEYVADMNLAHASLADGNYGRAVQLLKKHQPVSGVRDPDLRGFEWRYLSELTRGDAHQQILTGDQPIHALSVSPDGSKVAVALWDQMRVVDLKHRRVITNLPPGGWSVSFLPDGNRVAYLHKNSIRVYNLDSQSEEKVFRDLGSGVSMAVGGRHLAFSVGQEVRVYDTLSWREVSKFQGATRLMGLSADGKRAVLEGREGLSVWSVEKGQILSSLQDSTNLVWRYGFRFRSDRTVAISPDGRLVAGARNNLTARGVFVLSLWDAESGRELAVMPSDVEHVEHSGRISEVTFSHDGQSILTSSLDHSIRHWDVATRQLVRSFQGHLGEVWSVAFFPDSMSFVSGAKDGEVNLWSIEASPRTDLVSGVRHVLGISRDGHSFAGLARDGSSLSIVRMSTRAVEQRVALGEGRIRLGPWGASAFISPDFRTLYFSLEDGRVRWMDLETQEVKDLEWAMSAGGGELTAMNGEGNVFLMRPRSGGVARYDVRTRELKAMPGEWGQFRAYLSASGGRIAFLPGGVGSTNVLQIWDASTMTMMARLDAEESIAPASVAAFSKDDRFLAVAHLDDTVRIWDASTGKLLGSFVGHKQGIRAIAFSPDGRTLATAGEDSTLKLWNASTRLELVSVRQLGATLNGLSFSPDGQWLIGGSGALSPNGGVKLFAAPQ